MREERVERGRARGMLVPDVLKLRALLHRGASPDLFTLWNFYSLRAGPPRAFAAPNRHMSLELLCAQGTTGHPWDFPDSSTASLPRYSRAGSTFRIVKSFEILRFCKIVVSPSRQLRYISSNGLILDHSPWILTNLFMILFFFSMRYIPQKR